MTAGAVHALCEKGLSEATVELTREKAEDTADAKKKLSELYQRKWPAEWESREGEGATRGI